MHSRQAKLTEYGQLTRNHFLSPEWVKEATAAVQRARTVDSDFCRLVNGLTLNLKYIISELPNHLSEIYNANNLTIFVALQQGEVKKIKTGIDCNRPTDFTVASTYDLFLKIFLGRINAAVAFVNRDISVEPKRRIYLNPAFSAQAIATGNYMLGILRELPTRYD